MFVIFWYLYVLLSPYFFNEGNTQIADGPNGEVNPLQDSEFKKTGKMSLLKGQSSYSPLGGGGIIRDDDDMEGNL